MPRSSLVPRSFHLPFPRPNPSVKEENIIWNGLSSILCAIFFALLLVFFFLFAIFSLGSAIFPFPFPFPDDFGSIPLVFLEMSRLPRALV